MDLIQLSDFHYMRRGKVVKDLDPDEKQLLDPIQIHKQGHGKALLLLHGFGSSPAVYRELLPKLAGYDAIACPALSGHASNIRAFSKATACDWLISAENAYDELSKSYETIDVLGLSLGGLLAYHLSQRVKIHHLYLLAPALKLKSNTRLNLMLARVLHYFGLNELRNRAGNILNKNHAELTYRSLPLTTIIEILSFIQTTEFKPTTCPTDVFLGRYDEVVDSKRVAELFNDLPANRIHWLENSAHVLPLDGDVDAIARIINDYNA